MDCDGPRISANAPRDPSVDNGCMYRVVLFIHLYIYLFSWSEIAEFSGIEKNTHINTIILFVLLNLKL